jgi:tetratricopeptide (TPR) repeat protein
MAKAVVFLCICSAAMVFLQVRPAEAASTDHRLQQSAIAASPLVAADAAANESGIEHFQDLLKSLFSILGKVLAFAATAIVITLIVRVLTDRSYCIHRINVPDVLSSAGHTGPVLAGRIFFRLSEIIQRVSALDYARGYSNAAVETDVAVDVAGMGLPVKQVIEMVGHAFGIGGRKKIDVDIFIEGPTLVALLKVPGQNPERFETPMDANLGVPLKELISKISEAILKYSNDEALQTFYGHVERNGEKAMKLARYRLEKYKGNKFMEARMVSAWARGLSLMKKYESAEEKIRQGIAINKEEGRLYSVWGLMLQEQGKHEEATQKLLMAFHLMKTRESKFRRSNVLTAIGLSYSKLEQTDSAVEYYKKAMSTDSNAHGSYFNLAKEYLRTGKDTALFFELLEKSLDRGLKPAAVLQDPELQSFLDNHQLGKLLEPYKE